MSTSELVALNPHDLQLDLVSNIEFLNTILAKNNIEIGSFRKNGLNYFNSLPPQQQQAIAIGFKRYLDVICDVQNNGIDFRDTIQSLWRISNKYNWTMNSDVLSKIEENDVVEIYLPDNTQLYRNLNYFRRTSYSISELVFYTWHELIEHEPQVSVELGEIATKIFLKQADISEQFKFTPYFATERFSSKRYVARLTSKSITAIRNRSTRQNEAALVVWYIDITGSLAPDLINKTSREIEVDLI